MSEFDQLFKEKIAEKEYPYSAKKWRSFKQKAGWSAGAGLMQTTLAVTISTVMAVLGCWLGYDITPKIEKVSAPVEQTVTVAEEASPEEIAPVVAPDTVEPVGSTTTAPVQPMPIRPAAKVDTTAASATTPAPAAIEPTKPRRPSTQQEGRVRHIYEINTDTIPNNDF